MSLRLYNTLSRSVEEFKPIAPPAVTMYVCGPTVYDDPHIGHARSAFVFDVLRRYLEYRKFNVVFVRNVTDVDDKIIAKAQQTNQSPGAVAEFYTKRYHEVLTALGIAEPTHEPRATKEIDAMLDLLSELVLKGAAYEARGDVYFSVRKFPGYGRLSNRSLDELQAGARVEPVEQKQDPLDFALWKAAKPGEPSWNSPWGEGRPGWHIECSAMSVKYLGQQFDIHGGGVDLVFPHHENEIAQAQAAGKPFAKMWIHNGLLTVNGEKMSKSLGNFITVDKALEDCHNSADVLKVFFLGAHYRSPMDYSSSQIEASYNRWFRFKFLLEDAVAERKNWSERWAKHFDEALIAKDEKKQLQAIEEDFEEAMDSDLNTPKALASLDKLVTLANGWHKQTLLRQTPALSPSIRYRSMAEVPSLDLGIIKAADMLLKLGEILGLFHGPMTPEITQEQLEKIRIREEARKKGDFQAADKIRKELLSEGIVLEDTPKGTEWRSRK